MGLREKAKFYREKFLKRAEKIVPKKKLFEKFGVSNFVIELFSDCKLQSQVETTLIGLISKFNVSNILINFLDEDENIYKLVGSKGLKEENKKDFYFDYSSYFIKALQSPVRIEELMSEPTYNVEINKFLPYNFKVIFPLIYGDEVKGFITLGEKLNKQPYTSEDFIEMESFGKIIGTAFYNSANLERIKKKYNEIKEENKNYLVLFEGFKNINLSENLEEALSIFYRTIRDNCNVNTANLLIKEDSGNIFKVIKSWGLSTETDNNFVISLNDEIFKNIIDVGEPMLLPDFQNIQAFDKMSELDKEKVKLFYTVPIKLGERCIGIFNIFNLGEDIINTIPSHIEQILSLLPFSLLPYIFMKLKEF